MKISKKLVLFIHSNKSARNAPVQFERADNIFGMDSFIASDPVSKKVKMEWCLIKIKFTKI